MTARNVTERIRGWAHWAAPYRALWLREKADHARTRADLAVADAERVALQSHFDLAVDQRNHARDVVAALLADKPTFTDRDAAWLADNGVGPA